MRNAAWDAVAASSSDELLTTGEAAKILNTSRQHVVDLCESGDLPFVTTGVHRRVRGGDVEALRTRTQRLSRDQLRSLWLSHAVAGRLVADPETVLDVAQGNLDRMRAAHPRGQAARWLDEWAKLLDGPVERVLEALTSRAPRFRELRQNSPFAALLGDEERRAVHDAFSRVRHIGAG